MATYSYGRQTDLDKLLDQSTNYGDYTSQYSDGIDYALGYLKDNATYQSKYADDINSTQEQLKNRKFSYDPNSDETYLQYKDSYTRAGNQAMEDTIGKAAARTGGLASSYAVSAGNQAYNQYMAALADKIPELKQLAYSMYKDEGDSLQNLLSNYMQMDQNDQGIWSANNTAMSNLYNSYLGADSNARETYNTNLSSLLQRAGLLMDDKTSDYNIWDGEQQLALAAQRAAAAKSAPTYILNVEKPGSANKSTFTPTTPTAGPTITSGNRGAFTAPTKNTLVTDAKSNKTSTDQTTLENYNEISGYAKNLVGNAKTDAEKTAAKNTVLGYINDALSDGKISQVQYNAIKKMYID